MLSFQQLLGFDWENFGILDQRSLVAYERWSHMEVRLYDCNTANSCLANISLSWTPCKLNYGKQLNPWQDLIYS